LETNIAVFRGKGIRKTIHKNEWWFSIVDVVEALSGTDRPRKYWNDLKTKLTAEGYVELSEKIGQLKLQSTVPDLRTE
jgi:DNA-damage-inducible protein D